MSSFSHGWEENGSDATATSATSAASSSSGMVPQGEVVITVNWLGGTIIRRDRRGTLEWASIVTSVRHINVV